MAQSAEQRKLYGQLNKDKIAARKRKRYYEANKEAIDARSQRKAMRLQDEATRVRIRRDLRHMSDLEKREYKRVQARIREKAYRPAYREANKDKISARNRAYSKLYRQKNKDKKEASDALYRKANKERLEAKAKLWRKANADKIRQRQTAYRRNKRKVDPLLRIAEAVRSSIYRAHKRLCMKKSSKTANILGCSLEHFMEHLKATAIKNYGYFEPTCAYHIDHIIPISTAKTIDEVIKLNHYSNLQYLTPIDNMAKSDKVDWQLKS